jgi:hypothetical protein
MFKITETKGFHITFANGVTVSVQFGFFNYCGKYPHSVIEVTERHLIPDKQAEKGVENAEVAIWDHEGFWLAGEYDPEEQDVIGYCSPEKVLDILNWASKR